MSPNGDALARVQITVDVGGDDITITRTQAADSIGRPTETRQQTVAVVYKDAQAWLRRRK